MRVDLGEQDFLRRLSALEREACEALEDTGANNLYLAFGTMEWQAAGRRARSPLVLIPVTLHPSGDHYGLILDEAGESTPNYSFLARFAADTGIDLSDLVEQLHPERDEDFLTTLEAIRHRLARAGRPEEVHPTVHLGLFQFSTSVPMIRINHKRKSHPTPGYITIRRNCYTTIFIVPTINSPIVQIIPYQGLCLQGIVGGQ